MKSSRFLMIGKLVLSIVFIGAGIWLLLSNIPVFREFINTHVQIRPIGSITVDPIKTTQKKSAFIVIGDTGMGDYAQSSVASAIGKYCQSQGDCEFGVIAGDVIYPSGVKTNDDPQFQEKFAKMYNPIRLPWYIALGNHDYQGCTDCYLSTANAGEYWHFPGRYYAIVASEQTTFLVIDTEQFSQDQQSWLKTELEKNKDKNVVIVGHRPIESHEHTKVGENWQGRQELKDQICNTALLYVAGHAHDLEDVGQLSGCSVRQVISGGGGAVPREVDASEAPFSKTTNGFLVLKMSSGSDEMTGEFYDAQSQLLHSFAIKLRARLQ